MSDQRSDWIASILAEALRRPASEREAYINRECGADADAEREVRSLIAAAGDAGGFLASPTVNAGQGTAPPAEASNTTQTLGSTDMVAGEADKLVGTRVGPYKLLELLGEGGFGAVYVAEQERPVRRRVALKVIKLGMDTRQVIARFEAERQALAMMDHPNIARVLDAGATDAGRPWFAMELVRGVPITHYCDAANLPANLPAVERLELFIHVCHAVQHAHQKGVIHRDLKPSNVLVTLHDGKPVPKVIDFGIAKAVSVQLTEKTVYTRHQQMIGTPAYMSPEQAEMSGLDIDTRSDVYSLGVLLYELLTGSTPFKPEDLVQAGWHEMQRIIREVDPPKPSTRVNTLGDTLPTVAARRRVEPKRLGILLRGDLDWIAMKCLEKDRTRRYETATSLADDVRRHLSGEPVVAAPPSVAYLARKFLRKHRRSLFSAALTTSSLIIGVIGVVWQASRAMQQQMRAEAAESQSTIALERANALRTIMQTIFAAPDIAEATPYGTSAVRWLLRSAELALKSDSASSAPEVELSLRLAMGEAYRRVGDHEAANIALAKTPALAGRVAGYGSELYLNAVNALNCALREKKAQCYDPITGLLPSDKGWQFVGTGLQELTNGLLHLKSSYDEYAYYSRSDGFRWSDGAIMRATLVIVQSDFDFQDNPAKMRLGFYLAGTDMTGQYYGVGIASHRVLLTNTALGNTGPTIDFDSTDDFHTYTLRTTPSGATLLIDGAPAIFVPSHPDGKSDNVFWGDATSSGGSESLIRSFQFSTCGALSDLNCDLAVNDEDLNILLSNYASDPHCILSDGDVDGDGVIGINDLILTLSELGTAYSQSIEVPEGTVSGGK